MRSEIQARVKGLLGVDRTLNYLDIEDCLYSTVLRNLKIRRVFI